MFFGAEMQNVEHVTFILGALLYTQIRTAVLILKYIFVLKLGSDRVCSCPGRLAEVHKS